jgi:FkbM family methyltransferase
MLLATLAVNCIIDVGGHEGEFYRAMRNTGYTGRIVSFEPFPQSFVHLQRQGAGDREWRGYQLALGRQAGELELNVPDSTGFASFLKPNDYLDARFPWAHWDGRTVRVGVERLDNIYPDIAAGIDKPRVFLKMDTQGWDGNVVEGARDTLADVQLLQSEISVVPIYHGMRDIIESLSLYTGLGFQLTNLFPVTFDAEDVRVLEYDCVMYRTPKEPGSTT